LLFSLTGRDEECANLYCILAGCVVTNLSIPVLREEQRLIIILEQNAEENVCTEGRISNMKMQKMPYVKHNIL
jgi:hypothetical protein